MNSEEIKVDINRSKLTPQMPIFYGLSFGVIGVVFAS
jgi:hypothetical protein